MEVHRYSFGIFILLTLYLQVYYIARYYIRYEYHQVIHFRQSFTFGCYICYGYLLQ